MRYTLTILIIISLLSCTNDFPDRDELINKLYQEKVDALRIQKDNICKENLLSKAILDVDSLVHGLINKDLTDTINFPSKPVRPAATEHIIGAVKKFDIVDTLDVIQ